jgi:hypothetical protein
VGADDAQSSSVEDGFGRLKETGPEMGMTELRHHRQAIDPPTAAIIRGDDRSHQDCPREGAQETIGVRAVLPQEFRQ